MGRSYIGISAFVGGTIGSFVPALWGGSELGLASILFSVVGGALGVFLGARLSTL